MAKSRMYQMVEKVEAKSCLKVVIKNLDERWWDPEVGDGEGKREGEKHREMFQR